LLHGSQQVSDAFGVPGSIAKQAQRILFNQLSKEEVTRLTALIKETGFMEIPQTSFPVKSDLDEYDKFGLQVTLDGKSVNIQWPDQNSTQEFIPPLLSQVQNSLDGIITEITK